MKGLRRAPGKLWQGIKFIRWGLIGLLFYEVQYALLLLFAGRRTAHMMTWVSSGWSLLACATALGIAFYVHHCAKKYWHEGHEKYDLALATLTMATHGRYNAHRDGDTYDVSCACGTYLGAVKAMAPDEVVPLLEGHTNTKIREVRDEVERKTRASAGSR